MLSIYDGIYALNYEGPDNNGGVGGVTILQGRCEGAAVGPFRISGDVVMTAQNTARISFVLHSYADGELVTGRSVERTDRILGSVELSLEHLLGTPFIVNDNGVAMTVRLQRLHGFA